VELLQSQHVFLLTTACHWYDAFLGGWSDERAY
jgi:hypothetical protein